VTRPAPSAHAAQTASVTPTPQDIHRAYDTIRPYVRRTPIVRVELDALTGLTGTASPQATTVTLKLEQLQCSGSFKARGAFANLLLRQVPEAGVVAASGGNHGAAVAHAAHRLGVPARIFVPTVSAPAKIERIRRLGAHLVIGGDRYADALVTAQHWAAESGALSVHAYDQHETLLGQGTVALELAAQAGGLDGAGGSDGAGGLDTVLVPVGGGGLIGGIAAYFAGQVRVVGVEPDGAPTLAYARAHGAPTDAPAGSIAADALAPRRIGSLVFPITQSYVSDVVLVDDDAIRQGQLALWQALRLLAEPAGAIGIAALLAGAYRPEPGERVAVIISGANTTPADFDEQNTAKPQPPTSKITG
jgi:threonine dehydratase